MYWRNTYCGQNWRRQYPPVDPSLFQQSLQTYASLTARGNLLIERLLASPETMQQLMEAAQAGQNETVNRIVHAAAGTTDITTSYTPMSVTFNLTADTPQLSPCCRMTMNLRWG
ncbi:hypothetical protein K8O68_16530 [Salipaludibacillus sp. CUR1]|uniref:hypothetical protein n=1 Tax=Salipaludibacillus sp. CUR1 TaxID=2820003 RepID=UPI001E558E1A|nr:hypothetical protein [Salipaludibacillus sp. CUR1]MCE7793996.1 hypothetical protein [Salipaludibacillus sp. CUR1]